VRTIWEILTHERAEPTRDLLLGCKEELKLAKDSGVYFRGHAETGSLCSFRFIALRIAGPRDQNIVFASKAQGMVMVSGGTGPMSGTDSCLISTLSCVICVPHAKAGVSCAWIN